jgi:CRISPR system Cascade subunit CasA
LALEIANATIFDHRAEANGLCWSPAEAARQLVAIQSFALGLGKSANARIRGIEWVRPYSADAILLRGVSVWLAGRSLFETLMLNLIPGDHVRDDLPPWEVDEPHLVMAKVRDGRRQPVRARGIVDRYTWQSRMVRLLPEDRDGHTVVGRLYYTQGRDADKSPDDPMKAYSRNKAEGWSAIGLSTERASWRDVHALLDLADIARKRPAAINHVSRLVRDGVVERRSRHTLNAVGLASKRGKAGKFLLWRHDRMPIPARLLDDAALIADLGVLLAKAEKVAGDLRARTRQLAALFLAPEAGPNSRKPDPKNLDCVAGHLSPERVYWSRLEGHFLALLRDFVDQRAEAEKRWLRSVVGEAECAYGEACAMLGTSGRAVRAVARVSDRFTTEDHSKVAKSRRKEAEA